MGRISSKGFIGIGSAIIVASFFLGTFFAVRYKSLNVSAVSPGACACSDSRGHAVAGECRGSSCY